MALSEVVGNEKALSFLRRAFKQGQITHAYLFVGPEGVGKFLAAKEFAKLLVCENPLNEELPDSCGRCRSCRLVEVGTHPDVRVIEPRRATASEEDVLAEAGATISIEQTRNLRRDAGLRPYMAKRKVYIVRDAERMSPEAANSILKTLEEPNPGVVIILTSANPSALLPTVVSRCQQIPFRPVKEAEVESLLLRESPGLTRSRAALVAALSGGRPGEAVRWLITPELFALRDRALELLCLRPEPSLVGRLKRAEELVELGAEWWATKKGLSLSPGQLARFQERLSRLGLPEVLDLAALWYRDVMALSGNPRLRPANADRVEEVSEFASQLRPSQAARALRAISLAKRNIRRNANLYLEAFNLLGEVARAWEGE